jgi:hypothetical protein
MPKTKGMFGIAYEEYVEGYRETFRPDGNESTRILQVKWNQRGDFLADLIGYPVLSGTTLQRRLPEAHPELMFLHAVDADLIRGLGVPDEDPDSTLIRFLNVVPGTETAEGDDADDSGENTDSDNQSGDGLETEAPETTALPYGKARYAVSYRALPFQVLADDDITTELDRFVERRQTFAGEAFGFPSQGFLFASDNKPVQSPVYKFLFTKELTYIWYQVPKVPETNIRACIGHINSATFDTNNPDGSSYPAGTLLMIAPDVIRRRNALGDILYEIAYKFLYRAEGWNTAPRPSSGRLEAIIHNDITLAPGPYDSADFATLFQFS